MALPATPPFVWPTFFGSSPDFRLNLQKLYELRLAEKKAGKAIRTLPTLKTGEPAQAWE